MCVIVTCVVKCSGEVWPTEEGDEGEGSSRANDFSFLFYRLLRVGEFVASPQRSRNLVAITTSTGCLIVIWHTRERLAFLEK